MTPRRSSVSLVMLGSSVLGSSVLAVSVLGCGGSSSGASVPDQATVVRDCEHSTPEPDYQVYECPGYAVGVTDEAEVPTDPVTDLKALADGFIEGAQRHRERYQAKIVVQPTPSSIAEREVRGVSVKAVDPVNESELYSAAFAVIVGRRTIICSTSLSMGLEKCNDVIEAFVHGAP